MQAEAASWFSGLASFREEQAKLSSYYQYVVHDRGAPGRYREREEARKLSDSSFHL